MTDTSRRMLAPTQIQVMHKGQNRVGLYVGLRMDKWHQRFNVS